MPSQWYGDFFNRDISAKLEGSPVMSSGYCTACGAKVTDRYCGQCGHPVSGAVARAPRPLALWGAIGGAILLVVLLVVMMARQPQGQAQGPQETEVASSGAGVASPPDISGMSPRQQFDTLFNVVMRASENGDTARAARFAPMAFMAYGQLPEVDADARYHAAVLRLHVDGDRKPALLLADTIQQTAPRHLFAYMIRGSAGQLAGDESMVRKALRDFLSAWDLEIASGKPEYQDHRIMLDQFRKRALAADSTRKS